MKIEATCSLCGTTFRRSPSAARTTNLFCSKRCNAKFHAAQTQNHTAEQFWLHVTIGAQNECWEWQAFRNPGGYGQTAWKGRGQLAHRVAMSLTDGDWANKSLVCHTCDNPPCCNPAHLWRGTNLRNQHDKITKGRARYRALTGELHSQAKLTAQQVAEIRASKEKADTLAEKHGISSSYVHSLRSRNSPTWKHTP